MTKTLYLPLILILPVILNSCSVGPTYDYIAYESSRVASSEVTDETALAYKTALSYADSSPSPQRERINSFPWPPPKASSTYPVPRNKMPTQGTLNDISSKISRILDDLDYPYKYYYNNIPNGFVMVTRLEQTDASGKSKSGDERWSAAPPSIEGGFLRSIFKRLTSSGRGYYRVFAIVVTDLDYRDSAKKPSPEAAQKWLIEGHSRLGYQRSRTPINKNHRCDILVYEFERISESDPPILKRPSRLIASKHLKQSNIYPKLSE